MTEKEEILGKLNEDQIRPVTDTEGPVLVLAGAGSGKTRVLTSRVAYMLEEGIAAPEGILAITFTNKAAGEMRDRLRAMLDDTGDMWICTIHSMCVRILRRYGEAVGVKGNFSIYDESDRGNVLKKILKRYGYAHDDDMRKSVRRHMEQKKCLGLYTDEYRQRCRGTQGIDEICEIMDAYDEHLRRNNALDFDDLLTYTLRLLRSDERSLSALSERFTHILVDEFQDTNKVQYEIIRLLASRHRNLFVVGDDDQSIYGWRGAEIRNILAFDEDFPDARVYKLQRNYRSTGSILSLANAIIKNNSERRDKTLWTDRGDGSDPVFFAAQDETDEAEYVAAVIGRGVSYGGARYSDYAVLMRINALTRSFEQAFAKYGIPFRVFGGFRFFERKEIKDLLAYMRLISNPLDDEAFERVANVPRRGIGDKTLEALRSRAAADSSSLYFEIADPSSLPVTASMKGKLGELYAFLREEITSSQSRGVDAIVRDVVDRLDLRAFYEDGTEEGDSKTANIDEFIASVEDFVRLNPDATLNDYLNQVTLSSDTDDMDDGDYVTVATIHSVKGLEFPQVFVCGLEEGIMPSSRAADSPSGMEEERRLMYVAVTRAKDRVYLTRSRSRFVYGYRERTAPSVFWNEAQASCPGAAGRGGGGVFRSAPYAGRADAGRDGYGYAPDGPFSDERGDGVSFASPAKAYMDSREKENDASYRVGMRVEHRKYGPGTVVAAARGGSRIMVDFGERGVIELTASLAPLKIVSDPEEDY